MNKFTLIILFLYVFTGFSQGNNCNINQPLVSTPPQGLPLGHLPTASAISYTFSTSFSSGVQSRFVEVTFGSGFQVTTPSIPHVVNGNTYTFDFSNSTNTTAGTFTLTGQILCQMCTGSTLSVEMRVIENGNTVCTSAISNPVWNESLPRLTQSLASSSFNNILKGTTVRYYVNFTNSNSCFRLSPSSTLTRNLQIINSLPNGAVFQQAFYKNRNATQPVNLSTQNLPNNQVSIDVNSRITNEFFIDIFYPCDFPGNTAENNLFYLDQTNTPCPSNQTVQANSLTINFTSQTPQPAVPVSFTKRMGPSYFTQNYSPGGTVGFEVIIRNTGNYPLSNIVIEDILPMGMTGTHIGVNGMATGPTQVGTPITLSSLISGSWQTISSTTYPNSQGAQRFRLNLNPGHFLLPGAELTMIIYGTTDNQGFSQTYLNTATHNYSEVWPGCPNGFVYPTTPGTPIPPDPTNPIGSPGNPISSSANQSFITTSRDPKIQIGKLICERPSCVNPGDELRFQLHVINTGNAPLDAPGIIISDILPPNLTLIPGSERYYMFPANTPMAHPSFIDCNGNESFRQYEVTNPSFITPSHSANLSTLNWHIQAGQLVPNPNIPNPIPPNFSKYSDRIVISFACRINNIVLPNNRGRNELVSTNRSSIVANINTSQATYFMCTQDELTAEKLVSLDGLNYSNHINAQAGTTVKYRLRLTNTGNTAINQIRIADDMPFVGDRRLAFINGLQCSARNSQFEINAIHTNNVSPGNLSYFTQHNPCLTSVFNYPNAPTINCCGTSSPTNLSSTPSSQGFVIDLGGLTLQPGDTWYYDYEGVLPTNVTNGLTACNSFSFRGTRANSNVFLEFSESNDACVTVENPPLQTQCEPCDQIIASPINISLDRKLTSNGEEYQLLQSMIQVQAPNTAFNQIRVNLVSYDFEASYEECLACDKHAFNNVGIQGGALQSVIPSVIVNGNVLSPFENAMHPNVNIGEVSWISRSTFDLSNTVNIPLQFFLPNFSKIECCKVQANICIRVTFLNDNCEFCERLICFNSNDLNNIEPVVACECDKPLEFDVNYPKSSKKISDKHLKTVSCDSRVKLPAGVAISMSSGSACEGDENCEARYEWSLVLQSNQRVVSTGNGTQVNFTLPTVGERYILYITTYCGRNKCETPCKIEIIAIKP